VLSVGGISSQLYTELSPFMASERHIKAWPRSTAIDVLIGSATRPHLVQIIRGLRFGAGVCVFVFVADELLFESWDDMDPSCTLVSGTVSVDQLRELVDQRVVVPWSEEGDIAATTAWLHTMEDGEFLSSSHDFKVMHDQIDKLDELCAHIDVRKLSDYFEKWSESSEGLRTLSAIRNSIASGLVAELSSEDRSTLLQELDDCLSQLKQSAQFQFALMN
jgi:hypothetical protein